MKLFKKEVGRYTVIGSKFLTINRFDSALCIYTPIGSIDFNNYSFLPRRGSWRGRLDEYNRAFPLPKGWRVEFGGRGKSYLELVGAPPYLGNVDWIIDEFDSSFNDLAIASLRYHLDHSVVDNSRNWERRRKYEDLITRLSESRPHVADNAADAATLAGWSNPKTLFTPIDPNNLKLGYTMGDTTPEIDRIYDNFDERERAYNARIQQARHDFVDIMPGLWS